MKQYELMNLDIGNPCITSDFIVGPYLIELVTNYKEVQPRLFHSAQSVEQRVIQKNAVTIEKIEKPASFGESLVTALVTCSNEPDAVLFSGNEDTEPSKGIYDLCGILSYLTGRRVHLPEDRYRYTSQKYHDGAVNPIEVSEAAAVAWSNRDKFATVKHKLPLWYYISIGDTSEAEIKTLLGCVALEIAQTIDQPVETPQTNDALKNLINTIQQEIEASQISASMKNSLRSATGHWGASNAQEKFRKFLERYDIVTANLNDLQSKRVRGVFAIRNGISHEGIIKYPQWVNGQKAKEQTAMFIVAQFIPSLVQEYINRYFGLQEFTWPRSNRTHLRQYIENGVWDEEQIEVGQNN